MTPGRVLFVDDDKNALDAFKRLFHAEFDVETAPGGEQALGAIHLFGPYAVIISDMQMPGMSGSEFLAQVRQLSPCSVRMVLTGHKSIKEAIEAVNQGRIFRYLTKPCKKSDLAHAIEMGLAQYQKNVEEKELVKQARQMKFEAASHGKAVFSGDHR